MVVRLCKDDILIPGSSRAVSGERLGLRHLGGQQGGLHTTQLHCTVRLTGTVQFLSDENIAMSKTVDSQIIFNY
jgi:hypothetical protein